MRPAILKSRRETKDRIARWMDRGAQEKKEGDAEEESEVLTHPLLTRAIGQAQKRVELQNFQTRKRLLEYDDVMNQQREVIYSLRRFALEGGEELKGEALRMVDAAMVRLAESMVAEFPDESDRWDRELIDTEFLQRFLVSVPRVADPAVWELHEANPAMGWRGLYRAGIRIGRDHIASVVNTLVLAYAGAALPLLLLFSIAQSSVGTVANSELVAEEIVRTLVGSIGLLVRSHQLITDTALLAGFDLAKLHIGAFGTLGTGLPIGNAAKVAKTDKQVVGLHGDGSFGINAMEIDTAVRHRVMPALCRCWWRFSRRPASSRCAPIRASARPRSSRPP